jgi:hypothetical protein
MKFRPVPIITVALLLTLAFCGYRFFEGRRTQTANDEFQANSKLSDLAARASGSDAQSLGGVLRGKGASNAVVHGQDTVAARTGDSGIVRHDFEPAGPPSPELEARLTELEDLSLNNDPESLQKILLSVTDPLPEIRAAALDAAMQFGSRDAIPELKRISANSTDFKLKTEIQKAIEFLEMPSLTEYVQAHPQIPSPLPAPNAK